MQDHLNKNTVLIDSHCHLDCLEEVDKKEDLVPYLENAKAHGVQGFLCISINLDDWPSMMALIEAQPNIWATVGVHPNEVPAQTVEAMQLLDLAQHPQVVGIGETGLDFYRSDGDLQWQYKRFITHINVAKQLDVPVIVHCRDAFDETYQVLKDHGPVKTIIHCFTGNRDQMERFLTLPSTFISFSGVVTFKNAKDLQEAAKTVPLDRMLVETDAPYLAPMPHRGKSNQPAYTRYVAEKVAGLKGVSLEEVAQYTTTNFKKLFGVSLI